MDKGRTRIENRDALLTEGAAAIIVPADRQVISGRGSHLAGKAFNAFTDLAERNFVKTC